MEEVGLSTFISPHCVTGAALAEPLLTLDEELPV